MCLVKKRLKSIWKYQWYLFDDGSYYPVNGEDALSQYSPVMLFYKQVKAKNRYFEHSNDAKLTANDIDMHIPDDEELLKEAEDLMDELNTREVSDSDSD